MRKTTGFALALLLAHAGSLSIAFASSAREGASPTGGEASAPASGSERPAARSEVRGVISDAAGLAVQGVPVRIVKGAVAHETRTDERGAYRFEVPAGEWKVEVQHPDAFTSATVEVGESSGATVDIELPLNRFLQTIEVTGREREDSFAETSFAATKTETHVLDLPHSIGAVTKEVIDDQNLMRLNEVAPFVAGVNEFSVYDDLTIRGFRNYDDRRVNGMRAYNSFWSQPLIAHLERVEIIKGPASAMFGDASPGGTVNLVTKKPLGESRREVTLDTGSFDRRFAAVDFTGPVTESGQLLYRLNVAGEDSESFRDRFFHEGYVVAPSFSYVPSQRTRVNLDLVYHDNDSVLDRGQPSVQGARELGSTPIELNVTQPGDRLDTVTFSATVSAEHALTPRWSIAAQHARYEYDEELVEHRISSFETPTVLNLLFVDRESEATVTSNTVYLSGKLETGAISHRVVVGVDTSDREDASAQRQANDIGTFDLLDPEYLDRDTDSYATSFETWGGRLETLGVYVQNQLSFGKWRVLAGLRHEDFATQPLGEEAQEHDALLPRLGVVYRPTIYDTVYASWVRGFEPPASWLNSPFYGGPFDPIDSTLYEVGYKRMGVGGRFLLTASVYEIKQTDVVVWANDLANPDLYYQRGEERARGAEVELNGAVTERVRVLFNYAYNDARIVEDPDPSLIDRIKENAPQNTATLWARVRIMPRLSLGGGIVYVDDRRTFDTALRLPDYALLHAGVYYDHGPLRLSLVANNLTDEEHWTGGYNFGRVFPGQPRSVQLGANYRF